MPKFDIHMRKLVKALWLDYIDPQFDIPDHKQITDLTIPTAKTIPDILPSQEPKIISPLLEWDISQQPSENQWDIEIPSLLD